MSALMIENGSKLSREELNLITTPKRTKTHRPVSHFDAANKTVEYAIENGYEIMSEEFGLNPQGSQMFGVLRLKPTHALDSMTRCIGIRNSHDKAFAFGLNAGMSVMVCSNLIFKSSEGMVSRKHTSGIDLDAIIPEIFVNLDAQYERLEENIDRMKNTRVTVNKAKQQIVEAAMAGVIASCDILPVLNCYIEPPHPEFRSKNEYSLHNAFTEVSKKYTETRANKFNRDVAGFFNLN